MRTTSEERTGFTLVELLVVIAIIGALVGLLLPAVQAARAAARLTQCTNNLKQQGLALHSYHGANGRLPLRAYTSASGQYDDDGFGWAVPLLPHLEEQALFDTIDPDFEPGTFLLAFWQTGSKVPGGDISIPVFRCPSSQLPSHVDGSWPGHNGYATSDYKACNGWGDNGLFYKVSDGLRSGNKIVRFKNIKDGLSKTIALGESAYYGTVSDWPVWIGAVRSDEIVLFKTQEPSIINCGVVPKSMDRLRYAVDDDCAFSWHDGGALFAFADGSVQFLPESINFDVYKFMGTKDDGNVINR